MPRTHFTYKTDADYLADAAKLGVDLRLSSDLSPLFRPIVVGGRTVGNRLAIHPMEGCDGTLDGKPDALTVRRWERFGAGGSKLIWGEATAVSDDARANPRQLLWSDETEKPIANLVARTREVHREQCGRDDDLLIVCQITHSGRYSCRKPLISVRHPGLDPITWVDKTKTIPVTADYPIVTDDWLEQLEDKFVEAARRAYRAGFDAIDIKQCHRYLLNELLAGFERPGRYGGSWENRTRFVRNVIGKIRAALGDVLIFSRIGAFDCVPYAMDPITGEGAPRPYSVPYRHGFGVDVNDPLREDTSEPIKLVGLLKELGVKLVNVSMGNPYATMHITRPFELPPPDGYATPEHPLQGVARHVRITAALQKAHPDVPMVGSGYSWLQHLVGQVGAANIADGKVAFVGVGRGAFAYPQWARDLADKGEMDKKEVCIAVSFCTTLMRAKGNEQGQFPSGCVPRDRFYAPIYKDALKTLPKKD